MKNKTQAQLRVEVGLATIRIMKLRAQLRVQERHAIRMKQTTSPVASQGGLTTKMKDKTQVDLRVKGEVATGIKHTTVLIAIQGRTCNSDNQTKL